MTPTYVKTVFGEPATVLYIDPPFTNKTHDDIDTTFEVNVTITNVTDLQAFAFNLTWDNSLITLVNVNFTTTLNTIWGKGHWAPVDNTTGVGFYDLAALSLASSFNGAGPNPLCKLTFNVQDPQTNSARNCSIHFDTHALSTSQPSEIAHTVADGSYTIAGREATVLITPSLTEKTYSNVDATFEVNVTVESVTDLFGFDLNVTWDSAFLNFSNCYYKDTLDALWGSGQWFVAENESGIGYYKFVAVSTADSFNTTRSQAMFTLEFIVGNPPQPNETMIHFATDKLSDPQAENITHLVEDGTYRFGSSLTITTVGSGSVTKSPNQAAYLNGTVVTLTASPSIGWGFAGWSGNASGLAYQTTVNMTSNKSVNATFTQNVYTFWIAIVGQGHVTLNNTGPYHFGDVVQLSAVPASGWAFGNWSGDLSGSVNPITLTINGNASATATFTQTTQNTYTLTISLDGNGSVTLSKTGPYNYSDVVQLTATANASWVFVSWTGNVPGYPNYTNPATLTMTGNFSVTAHFKQPAPPQAVFNYSPSEAYVNMTVTFDATASKPGSNGTADSPIANYTWNFGDGNITSDNYSTIVHTYATDANYTVTLNVTDSQGLWNTTSETVKVAPAEPQANFTWYPAPPKANETVTLDATASKLGWNGTAHPPIVNYTWDFGDGNITSGNYLTIVHTYSTDGNYTVTLNIVDSNELKGNITKMVTVQESILIGDLNGDGVVNILDAITFSNAFGATPSSSNWNPKADLNGDGVVNILDAIILANHFGQSSS
ncbi:MAG: PKD domain-containing protein [Candidatus Bathyarchaeia archaeon]|jgi:PKD repeat protein